MSDNKKMANKEEKTNIVLERVYNVPLRREFLKVPNWRRTEKAVKALREFIIRHMKSDNVILGKYANQLLWKHGIKNPPHHIKVLAKKDDKGKVSVELVELPAYARREIEKQKDLVKKTEKKETKKEETKKIEGKIEEAKKEKEEKAKEIEKEEIKELKKEPPKAHMTKQLESKQVERHPTAPKSV